MGWVEHLTALVRQRLGEKTMGDEVTLNQEHEQLKLQYERLQEAFNNLKLERDRYKAHYLVTQVRCGQLIKEKESLVLQLNAAKAK
jgi:hypothetical protein